MARKNPERSKRGLLETYADDGFVPPDSWKADDLARVEVRRLMLLSFMGCIAAETPRRLGSDAESFELAGDKFLSKGVAHTYWKLWQRMMTAKHAPLPIENLDEDEMYLVPPETWLLLHAKAMSYESAKQKAKTVIWERWWAELKPNLLSRRRALATFALYRDKVDWGYRVVTSIGSEIEWVEGKFDDHAFRYGDEGPAV